jgi:predicted phosphate transport protein (TIGR00153 family)
MIGNYQNVEEKVKEIKAVEKEGDEIVRQIMNALNSTFITPLDREDIHQLAHTMDSMIDYIDGTADRMYLYQIRQPDPRVLVQANILVQCTAKLIELIRTLRKLDHEVVAKIAQEIKDLEHESDSNYRQMVSDLLNAPNADPIEAIKLKELYDNLENCADFAEDVTNLVEGIVLKNA